MILLCAISYLWHAFVEESAVASVRTSFSRFSENSRTLGKGILQSICWHSPVLFCAPLLHNQTWITVNLQDPGNQYVNSVTILDGHDNTFNEELPLR